MNIRKLANQNDLIIREVVLDVAQKKNQIIHGTRALNEQVSINLKRSTSDYDIFTDNPKKSARELVTNLKRRLGKDFKVVKGKNPGTYKVKYGEESVVDYTQKRGKIKSKKILGVKYKDINTIKRGTQRLVKKSGTEYRREKDLDTLERIKQVERIESMF